MFVFRSSTETNYWMLRGKNVPLSLALAPTGSVSFFLQAPICRTKNKKSAVLDRLIKIFELIFNTIFIQI